MDKSVIFPIVKVLNEKTDNTVHYCYYTFVRKQAGGVWWLGCVLMKGVYDELNFKEASKELSQKFLITAYRELVCGLVNVNVKDSFGNSIWIKDENQESENVRIKKLIT